MFYALRYLPHVDVKDRKHEHAVGRFDSWVEADDARVLTPVADLLEVVQR